MSTVTRLQNCRLFNPEGSKLTLTRERLSLTDHHIDPALGLLMSETPEHQSKLGYFHTLREICQQPSTWRGTADWMVANTAIVAESLRDIQSLIFTGSGSSEYLCECVRLPLAQELGVTTEVVSGGTLLVCSQGAFSHSRPALLVSVARSGDSPESAGAVERLLKSEKEVRHLVITCNATGRLALLARKYPNVKVIALDDATLDRSLVMTSSFTNLALAARFLGFVIEPDKYRKYCERTAQIAEELLRWQVTKIAALGRQNFRRAVFLGSGTAIGAARESALKMLEMTAGQVAVLCDSFLGFRHGPICFTDDETLVVCFLSSKYPVRQYEYDFLQELNDKRLGCCKLVVGSRLPADLIGEGDVGIDLAGLSELGDHNSPLLHTLVGQLLGFFSSIGLGLKPDSPSTGVINRVVSQFKLY